VMLPISTMRGLCHLPVQMELGFVWEEVINIRTSVENRDGRLPLV